MIRRSHSGLARASRSTTSRGGAWLARALLIALVPTSLCGVGAPGAGASSDHATAVPAFCSRLSLTKLGSIIGGSVSLLETSSKAKIIACIFTSSSGTVSIETQTGLPAASTSTLSGAEKLAKANFPAGLKITFAAAPSIGSTAYTWSAKIAGTPYVGLNANRGSNGYFIEMQGKLQLSVLEKLITYEIAAK